MNATRPLAVFFAFANDRSGGARYLRNLPEEQRHVREAMEAAVEAGLCEVVERSNATIDEVLDVFQDPDYRDRIAVFHFGGHAGGAELLMESAAGEATVAHAGGLARFLGGQRGLELVFLNGCSSRGQVQGLLDAGVPAVVATSEAIDDVVATEFSARFYKALASGAPIRTAYAEAQAAVETRQGEPARGTYRSFVPDEVAEDRWPWDLYIAPGAEDRVARWSLPLAARDPLFGLPPLPAMDLPAAPFKHLSWFGREDAHVFFGRGREIRDLYEAITRPEAEPIILLFGATGAGKSSLLAAGLAPRLEATHEVVYLRRDGAVGLAGTLARAFGTQGDWRAREEAEGKPLVVILDQVEEAWTRPCAGGKEPEELAALLRSIFAVRETRPRGRLILGFRKEWLAEVLRLVDGEKLPRFRVEVTHLDRDAVAEAIAGPARSESLCRHYRLEVEDGLPEIVADDLLEDSGAAVAPTLQILLTKMWALATRESPEAPRFTVELYRRLKRGGILLDDFLGGQLESLRQWRPDLADSGLVLDLLAHHTTALGTAETRKAAEIAARYGGRPEIPELLRQCQDRYLLSCADDDTRLAHDTLAPLVRRRFEISDLPGQRASRILQQRAVEWAGGKDGSALDAVDLATVEQGAGGMRVWTADERRLVERSRKEQVRHRRQRRGLRWAAVLAVLSIAASVVVTLMSRWTVGQERARAEKEVEMTKAATSFVMSMFESLDPNRVALDENTLPKVLDRARTKAEKDLAGNPELQDGLRETIGVVNLNLGRLTEAEGLLEKVVAFRRRELGEEHPDTLDAKTELAHIYASQARRKEAEDLYRQVLDSRSRSLGEKAPKRLEAMSNLATLYRDQGHWKKAEELNARVLAGFREVRGERHPDTLKAMSNQANIYALQGRLAEAEKLSGRVLELRRELGPENPETLAAMTSHANIVADRGRLKEAEDLDQEALKISRRVLGPEHPDTLMYLQNLANVLYEQRRLAEAESMGREILAAYRNAVGPEHPDTIAAMSNLAAMVGDQGRYKEAEALLREAYGASLRTRGPDHPDTLKTGANLAAVYQEQGRIAEAEPLLRETLARQRRVLGPENPATLQAMHNLGVLCHMRGRLAEAEALLGPAAAGFRKMLGDESNYTHMALKNLADVYQAQGRQKEADDLRRQIGVRQPRPQAPAQKPD